MTVTELFTMKTQLNLMILFVSNIFFFYLQIQYLNPGTGFASWNLSSFEVKINNGLLAQDLFKQFSSSVFIFHISFLKSFS